MKTLFKCDLNGDTYHVANSRSFIEGLEPVSALTMFEHSWYCYEICNVVGKFHAQVG